MTDRNDVIKQLQGLGISMKGWGAAEINELPAVLMPREEIKALLRGWYENGFATLVATNNRLLLIDKKLLHLTIEDVRYDMVAEVDFSARLTDASVRITTINKTLRFTSFRPKPLRELTHYVQQRVMELRQAHQWQEYEPTPVPAGPLQTLQDTLMPQQMAMPGGMPLVSTQITPAPRPLVPNQFANFSLTTKHNFLPKVPRRFRSDGS